MKKIIILLVLIIFVTGTYATSPPASFDFLMIKNYARALSMGEAYTSIPGDTGSLLFNPGSIGYANKKMFGISHYSGIGEYNSEQLNGIIPFPWGNIGFSFSYFYLPEDEIFDYDGNFQFKIRKSDLNIKAGYGRKFLNNISGGVMVGLVNNKLGENASTSVSFGIGGIYSILTKNWLLNPKDKFTIGLALKNIGTAGGVGKTKTSMPINLSAGISYLFSNINLLGSFDIVNYFYGQTFASIGLEYRVIKYFALRTGYRLGYDLGNFSAGFGAFYHLNNLDFRLDYSFNLNSEATLGHIHSVNLELHWGGVTTEVKRKKEKINILIAPFKNVDGIAEFDYLKKSIPDETKTSIELKEPESIKVIDITKLGKKPSLDKLRNLGVQYIVGGSFSRKEENILVIKYIIVDVNKKEKIAHDTFEFNIEDERIVTLYEKLSDKIIEKIKKISSLK